MIRHYHILTLATMIGGGVSVALAQETTPKEMSNVENISGCFDVTYRFIEDGVHDMFSKQHKQELNTPSREWISFKEKEGEKNTFILQHVTFSREEKEPQSHFHEIWKYHPNTGSWTQEVRSQAYGSEKTELRYQCTASWNMNQWQCHSTNEAGKPFRDNGAPFGFKRTDYDHLNRNNSILVTPNGWVQSEQNKKISASGAVAAYELGWITYQRLEDGFCETAIKPYPREIATK
ncbi:DUF6607 family protein [Candidatus Nitrosacidococcus tergens]|uniref:Secreted protein n=1 Tax=Candidatus Nitrosacidococcus tergens TaxID=553981 RepID=A0A7G1QA59_9GAMM|nr:DUF6607 family protein [Candidatus Nitrosacidococcus tergens]CAB1275832.1 exported protein of unknown function [Candidatus Nitrosacidococcus tergens]